MSSVALNYPRRNTGHCFIASNRPKLLASGGDVNHSSTSTLFSLTSTIQYSLGTFLVSDDELVDFEPVTVTKRTVNLQRNWHDFVSQLS